MLWGEKHAVSGLPFLNILPMYSIILLEKFFDYVTIQCTEGDEELGQSKHHVLINSNRSFC